MANTYLTDARNITMGAAKIWTDNGSGLRPIGFTLDGQKIQYIPSKHEIKSDQFGDVPVNVILTGESVKLSFTMLETTLQNLMLAMPFATLYSDGNQSAVGIGHELYASYYDKAVMVKIHPLNTKGAGNTDDESYTANDYHFWKCVNLEAVEIGYYAGKERVYQVRMTVLPDSSKGAGYYLGIHGDISQTELDTTAPSTVSIVESGLAQDGDETTITLASTASDLDDYYVGMLCQITAKGRAAITDYDGTSKVATVSEWIEGDEPSTNDPYTLLSKNVRLSVSETMTLVPATDSELSEVDADTAIEIVFSEALDLGSAINPANYCLKKSASHEVIELSTISYDTLARRVTITPIADLEENESSYELIIQGVKDLTGNAMQKAEVVRFKTVA